MTTYDPLTPDHLSLLDELDSGPVRINQHDKLFTERGRGFGYLQLMGLVSETMEHVSPDAHKTVLLVTRTSKPRP